MAARSHVGGLALMWRQRIRPFQSGQRVAYPYAVQAYVQPLTSAVLNFTGPTNLIKGTSKGMTAILSFAGITNLGKTLTKNLVAATLTFTGVLRKVTSKNFVPAVLSFTGPVNLKKVISRGVVAILSFSGQNMASSLYNSFLYNAGRLYGSSTFVKNTSKGLGVAILSFTGPTRLTNFIIKKLVTAVLSFTGTLNKQTIKILSNASLSFVGSTTRRTGKGLTAGLSFVGLTLKITQRGMTAVLSFSGGITSGKQLHVILTAGLSFAGVFVKQLNRGLVGRLSFSGSRDLYQSFIYNSGALYGTGSFIKQTIKGLAIANLSFLGTASVTKQLHIALTATLSMTGQFVKQAQRNFVATLSFTGVTNLPKVIGRALQAVLDFDGTSGNAFVFPAPPSPADPGTILFTLPADIDMATTEIYPYQIDLSNYLVGSDTIGKYFTTMINLPGGQAVAGQWRGSISFNGNIMTIPLLGSSFQLGHKYQLNITFVVNTNKTVTFLTFIHVVN
jgi:hypothetical protein